MCPLYHIVGTLSIHGLAKPLQSENTSCKWRKLDYTRCVSVCVWCMWLETRGRLQGLDPCWSTFSLPRKTWFCPVYFITGSKSQSRERHPSFAYSNSHKGRSKMVLFPGTLGDTPKPDPSPLIKTGDSTAVLGPCPSPPSPLSLPLTQILLAQRMPASR